MKILITGGTGFIGQTLVPRLLSAGHRITILSRSPDKVVTLFGNQIDPLNSIRALTDSEHFNAIINLAGAPIFDARWTDERKHVLLNSRLAITNDLVKFITRSHVKPEALLSGSAIGYYGDQGDNIIDESSSAHYDFGHHLCSEWEKAAEKVKIHGVRICLLRTGLVIGKKGGFLQKMITPFKLGLGGPLDSGKQWMSWIHIQDHVEICITLITNPRLEGIFNLTAPNPVTNRDFVQTLAKILKRPALLPIPAWLLRPVLGEMSMLLLGGQRVIPKRMQEAGFQFKFPQLDAALQNVLNN